MKLSLRAPVDLLQRCPDDLNMLLRLGAAVNALESNARLLVKLGPPNSDIEKLSGTHCLLMGLAHLRELVRTIELAGYLDRLLALAEKGMPFSPIGVSLDEARTLLSPGHPELPLSRVRNKVAFHWDPVPFQTSVNAARGKNIDLWAVSGEPPDRMFVGSAYAIAEFVLDVPVGTTAEGFMKTFLDAVTSIGHLLEAAFLGILVEVGEPKPSKYFVKEE